MFLNTYNVIYLHLNISLNVYNLTNIALFHVNMTCCLLTHSLDVAIRCIKIKWCSNLLRHGNQLPQKSFAAYLNNHNVPHFRITRRFYTGLFKLMNLQIKHVYREKGRWFRVHLHIKSLPWKVWEIICMKLTGGWREWSVKRQDVLENRK